MNLNISLESVLFFEFTLSLVIGLVILFFLGLLTAGITLNVPRTPIGVGEAIVGLLYLISDQLLDQKYYLHIFRIFLHHFLIHWIELVRFSIHPAFRDNPYDWEVYFLHQLFFLLVVF